jgi:hypothetical protein
MTNPIYSIIDLFITSLYIGIFGTVFRRQYIEMCAKAFEFLYNKTGFFVFKIQADGMRKPYMKILIPIIATIILIVGITDFISNIWGINILSPFEFLLGK